MTLIAYHANGDHAAILTDTLAYNGGGAKMGSHSKVHLFPHLDAALMTQGDCGFAELATVMLATKVTTPTFDQLVTEAPADLLREWRAMVEATTRKMEASIFLVGWSEDEERFVGWRFLAEHDFVPEREDGPFMMPSPTFFRAADFELDRLATKDGIDATVLSGWRQEVPMLTPDYTAEDWTTIGLAAHTDRSLSLIHGPLKVFIGGSLHLTKLERGKQSTERIHTFDTSGPEFALMVAGTLHPQSQAAPCLCGSGKRFVDCCLARHLDEPCPCGTSEGKTIRECCAITAQEATETAPATA